MAACAWCLKGCADSTLLNGIPYHWKCLKLRSHALRGRSGKWRRRARSARGRAAHIVGWLRRTVDDAGRASDREHPAGADVIAAATPRTDPA